MVVGATGTHARTFFLCLHVSLPRLPAGWGVCWLGCLAERELCSNVRWRQGKERGEKEERTNERTKERTKGRKKKAVKRQGRPWWCLKKREREQRKGVSALPHCTRPTRVCPRSRSLSLVPVCPCPYHGSLSHFHTFTLPTSLTVSPLHIPHPSLHSFIRSFNHSFAFSSSSILVHPLLSSPFMTTLSLIPS